MPFTLTETAISDIGTKGGGISNGSSPMEVLFPFPSWPNIPLPENNISSAT
jgi:hypothetical protein